VNYYREYNKEKVSNSFIAREAVKGFLSVVAVLCDLVIIYVVIKTKKLNRLKYFHLINWNVLHILCCMNSPYILFLLRSNLTNSLDSFPFLLLQMERVIFVLFLIVNLLLVVDWFMKASSSSLYSSYISFHIHIKFCFCIFAIVFFMYSLLTSHVHHRVFNYRTELEILYFFSFCLFMLTVVVIIFKKLRSKFSFCLLVPIIFILCWTPYCVTNIFILGQTSRTTFIYSYFFSECMIYANSYFNLVYFAFFNKSTKNIFSDVVKSFC
jgi:hypothetical protein